MLKAFAVMGVPEQRVAEALGLKGKADITLEHMVTLTGFYNSLKEGELTVEQVFPEGGGLGTPKPAQRKSEQSASTTAEQASTPGEKKTEPAAKTEPGKPEPATTTKADPPKPVGAVVKVHDRGNGAAIVELSTGFVAASKDPELIAAAKKREGSGVVVELSTRPSSDPSKYAPTLEEITEPESAS
jgi:hypothetical protein